MPRQARSSGTAMRRAERALLEHAADALLAARWRAVSGPATGDSGVGTAADAVGRVGRPDPGRDPGPYDRPGPIYWVVQSETSLADRGGTGGRSAAAAIAIAFALPALNPSVNRRANGAMPGSWCMNTPVDPGRDSATMRGRLAGPESWPWPRQRPRPGTWRVRRPSRRPGSAARCSTRPPCPTRPTMTGPWSLALESVAATVPVPSLDSLVPDTAAAGAMLQQVGDRLTHGVRPLSDTARHAFGFLLGTTSPKPEAPTNPPAQKGA